jgi:hypothetical protein
VMLTSQYRGQVAPTVHVFFRKNLPANERATKSHSR